MNAYQPYSRRQRMALAASACSISLALMASVMLMFSGSPPAAVIAKSAAPKPVLACAAGKSTRLDACVPEASADATPTGPTLAIAGQPFNATGRSSGTARIRVAAE